MRTMREEMRSCGLLKSRGFTFIELLISMAIIAGLASAGLYAYTSLIKRAQIAKATSDIQTIQDAVEVYKEEHEVWPETLEAIGRGTFLDPWGNVYRYQNLEVAAQEEWRRDQNSIPLNSTFDLWSMGSNKKSKPSLTELESHDDIVRGKDGSFIGFGKDY